MRLEQAGITNLIAVAIAMAVAAGITALLPRLPLPGVVLKLGIGALIGPQVLGLVHPGVTLNFLADFGLGMLFLMAGSRWTLPCCGGAHCATLLGCVLTAVIAVGASTVLSLANVVDAPILTALALSTTTIGPLMPLLCDAPVCLAHPTALWCSPPASTTTGIAWPWHRPRSRSRSVATATSSRPISTRR